MNSEQSHQASTMLDQPKKRSFPQPIHPPRTILNDISNLLDGSSTKRQKTDGQDEEKQFDVDSSSFSKEIYDPNPFDKSFRLLRTDNAFEQVTPCGKDTIPVTVVPIHKAYHGGGKSLNSIEYFMVIQRRCIEREVKFMVHPHFMSRQTQVTITHRNHLVDWMIEAQTDMLLNKITLFLAVSIFDRFLNKVFVKRKHLNKVGVTCLWIAHKFEELLPPKSARYEAFCDHVITKTEILKTELEVLDTIQYELVIPTIHTFLMKLLDLLKTVYKLNLSKMTKTAHFLTTIALLSTEILQFRPSLIAAAAVRLSAELSDVELFWNDTLEYYSGGWIVLDIVDCQTELRNLWNLKSSPDYGPR